MRSPAPSIRFHLAALLFASMASVFGAQAHASTVVLPPVTGEPSGEHHVGKVIWADLVTPDPVAAKRFYGALFGWTFQPVPGDRHYTVALLDGEPLAGVYEKAIPSGERQQARWLSFIAVENIDAAVQSAVANGGKVLAPAHSYPHRGFIWSSLLVADPSRELAFYKTLFGYQVFDLAADTDGGAGVTPGAGKHYVLASDDYARAGLNALPEDSKHRRPHWLDFVRVDDAAAAASKAATLGGRILVEPRPDRHGGKLAVLADPTGAVFGVMEWPQGESKEEPQ
jgi:predicted enzyme related to lactoylglutathione lyase